ncbi:hypothetical protein [Phytoactinopolyspora mesophila]|uniref:Cytochrome d ubiquinol oxidase subunit II n=1 Tax=Phytoactinopolyspora mesophila TaxID=2650750 RepID=A0A7K3M556_9ACTN|nr:hypothetical protein [Phytoactinopolyspora mesophila]NDL58072.1 hypothetical protein [Phytoactinopolyspora mesophila]
MTRRVRGAGGGRRFGMGRRVLAVAALALTSMAGLATTASGSGQPGTGDEPEPSEHGGPNVVLAGVAGLAWEDVTRDDMPTLYEMAGTDAVAALTARTIRSRTCAVDGWLTVSSGRRSTDLIDSDGDGTADRYCRPAPTPVRDDDGGAMVPGWQTYVEEQKNHAYNPTLGLVGDRLGERGMCATAAGPGAALALADTTGRVASYGPNPAEVDTAVMSECPVTVVDLGAMPAPAPAASDEQERQNALEQRRQVAGGIDDLLASLREELPENTALLVIGVSDSGPTAIPLHNDPSRIAGSALRVAVASGPTPDGGEYGPRWLTSASTRWSGIVQITDVASTLLEYAGFEEPTQGSVGRPWRTAGAHPAEASETIADLLSTNTAAQIYRTQSGPFFQFLGIIQLVVFGIALAMVMLRPASRPAVLRSVHVAALAIASFPVASYLANLAPWAHSDRPALYLWSIIVAISVALTTVAVTGPWRRRIYGPAGFLGAVTAGVMAIDVTTGSNLQQLSLLGLSPVVAGRFYGLGNIPFAIFIAACLVAAAALAQLMLDRGVSRRTAGAVTAVIGMVATIVTGAPQAGADVGGILAAIPGFAVLVIGVLGTRLTIIKLFGAGVAALAVFLLIAWLDWLRPAGSRTHFGGFFDDLTSGEALTVIWRKMGASFGTLNRLPYYAWTVPIAYAAILWLTSRSGAAGVRAALARWPIMNFLIWSGLMAGAAGFAANDSGIIIPALLLTTGIPLVVSAIVAARREADQGTPVEEPSTPELRAGATKP